MNTRRHSHKTHIAFAIAAGMSLMAACPGSDVSLGVQDQDSSTDSGGTQADAALVALQDIFAPTGSMTAARMWHTATLLPDGQVLIAGGEGNMGQPLASVEQYHPGAGTFAATSNMSEARTEHTAALLANGKVLIAGGGNYVDSGGSQILASAELYDPATGTFTTTGSMAVARFDHTATLLSSGMVLIAGGGQFSDSQLASAELYDPGAGIFTAAGSMTVARKSHTATLLQNQKLLIVGGGDGTNNLASAELYDPAAGTFTATGSMSVERYGYTATLLGNGTVRIAGGMGPLASAELYQ